MKIVILYSLPTLRAQKTSFATTDQDTYKSALEIKNALIKNGHEISLQKLSENTLNIIPKIKADLIFNLIDWDGHDLNLSLKAWEMLEKTNIPFTGSSYKCFYSLQNKNYMKNSLLKNNLPTPIGIEINNLKELSQKIKLLEKLNFPVILKLSNENCSIGLTSNSVCENLDDLKIQAEKLFSDFSEPVMVEEFINGREFQITVIEMLEKGPVMLPPAEIIYKKGKNNFLTYESRWLPKSKDYKSSKVTIAKLSKKELITINSVALKTFKVLGFSDYTRLDVRLKNGIPYILEANVNPGLGDELEYGLTLSFKKAGFNLSEFLWQIIDSCKYRFS